MKTKKQTPLKVAKKLLAKTVKEPKTQDPISGGLLTEASQWQKLRKKKEIKDKKIKKLIGLLNQPETGCLFWGGYIMQTDIIGVRPIERTTKTIINEHGFNPLEQLKKEIFPSVFFIKILDSKITAKEEKFLQFCNKTLEQTGIKYLMSHDINIIYNYIRNKA